MKIFHSPLHARHYPRNFLVSGARQPNPEVPERAEALLKAARADGHEAVEQRMDFGLAPAAAVHTPEYLSFLTNTFTRWQRIEGASDEVIPNIHPSGCRGGYPASAVGQAGYHMADTSCPISEGTWPAALTGALGANLCAFLRGFETAQRR